MAKEQQQFLDVVDRDEAERRWRSAISPLETQAENVLVSEALGRILAEDVISEVDVPGFDRSNVDGYAIISEESFHSSEESPKHFLINDEEISPGMIPQMELKSGTVSAIATGGMIPRGADAAVMVEHTTFMLDRIQLNKPVSPGTNISYAGTDIACGELTLFSGLRLTARETGLLAAIGVSTISVYRKPKVAVISTGNEIIAPGQPILPGQIYDANARMLADAVRENGGVAVEYGIVADDYAALKSMISIAIQECDIVVLSGGTSKGGGDISYQSISEMDPGILVHGVALKPGKPVCLGASGKIPIAVLPGFPTSAIFTFHEFVAPIIRELAGISHRKTDSIPAVMSSRLNSERGRTEYLLVGLMPGTSGLTAYPMGKGSGSVTTFSRADGFVVISRHQEYIEANEKVEVVPIGRELIPADLVVIGSHCIGLDSILSQLSKQNKVRSKTLWVGSQGGLDSVTRGECDISGTHLLDPITDQYNTPFLNPDITLIHGYGRMQGFVFRSGDPRFSNCSLNNVIEIALASPDCRMVCRNRGSGTRVLIDQILEGRKPVGYNVEVRSHHAVAASVIQGRADWGITIEPVARQYGLEFIPIRQEFYDFAVKRSNRNSSTVHQFVEILKSELIQSQLIKMGFIIRPETGSWL